MESCLVADNGVSGVEECYVNDRGKRFLRNVLSIHETTQHHNAQVRIINYYHLENFQVVNFHCIIIYLKLLGITLFSNVVGVL